MSDFFGELMESIDSLTEEQVNALLSKLEVKRAGSRKVQEESKDEQEPMACPHCGSIAIKKHGRKSGRQRYYVIARNFYPRATGLACPSIDRYNDHDSTERKRASPL